MDKQTHFVRQNNRGQKRGTAKESVAAALLSFFSIIFCPSVSVRVVGNEPLSRVSGQVVIHPRKCPMSAMSYDISIIAAQESLNGELKLLYEETL